MTDKFNKFRDELLELCKKHSVCIFPSMYDDIEVWSASESEIVEQIAMIDDFTDQAKCGCCDGSGLVVRDADIGTDQECFVCDGIGKVDASL